MTVNERVLRVKVNYMNKSLVFTVGGKDFEELNEPVTVNFTVTGGGGSGGGSAVTVNFTVTGGGGSGGGSAVTVNFTVTGGADAVVVGGGGGGECFTINILDDNVLEGEQKFTVTIINPPDMVNSLFSTTDVIINDDEGKKIPLDSLYISIFSNIICNMYVL